MMPFYVVLSSEFNYLAIMYNDVDFIGRYAVLYELMKVPTMVNWLVSIYFNHELKACLIRSAFTFVCVCDIDDTRRSIRE